MPSCTAKPSAGRKRLAALNEIGREATASLDLETVLAAHYEQRPQILGANTASVILLDKDGDHFARYRPMGSWRTK